MSTANPYLIPLRSSTSGTNNAGPTSTSSTTKRQQATVLMSSTPGPASSFGGSNNTRSDWLLSSSHNVNIAQQQHLYLHQGIPMKQPKAPSVGSTSSSSSNRRNSIDRAATTTTSHITVVKLKHEQQQEQERENNKPVNRQDEIHGYHHSPSITTTRMNRNVLPHNNTMREPDDDDINRFIYEDNEKTLLENSDGSPIRCLDDVRDILPPSNEDAAKQLARMIQEQGKALLEIRAREQDLSSKHQSKEEKEKSPRFDSNKNPNHQLHEPPSRRNQQQQNNGVDNFMLPTTFRPVPLYQNINNNNNNNGQKMPPPRWKVPPTLPPRRRLLVADGPRLDLLEMLDRLDEEDREGGGYQNKKKRNSSNNNGNLNSSSSSSSCITSELWVFIFEFLDPRTLCRVSAVSRRWLCIARSEFLWEPILSNNFQHLIQEEEEEVRFQQRTATGVSGTVGGMAPPPPRPSDNNVASPANSDTDPISMCPSLARISNFVNQHRGRIQQELTAAETRIQRTEERISSSILAHQHQHQHQHHQQASFQMTGPELELTNERAHLLRQLQELEPKFRNLTDRLRDAEATQAVQARALNEAIVSSKRSGLQLHAIHRRSQIADRRHKETLALEDLERRICMLVLAGAGALLPVSLRKSIRCFSQLELLLMSCASQEALSELPRRWQKVKDAGVGVEVLEELRRKIEVSEDPSNGVLGKLANANGNNNINNNATGERRNENFHRNNSENSTTTATTASFDDGGAGSKRIRFADSLLSRRHNNNNQQTSTSNNHENDNNNHTQPQARTFAQDTIMTKERLIAEMALNYVGNDCGLEKFLFS